MSDVRIIRAAKEQVAEITRVFLSSREYSLPHLPVLHSAAEVSEYFCERVFVVDEVFVALDEHQRVMGFIAFNDEWINHLYVLPVVYRQGIGSRLLSIAQEHSAHLYLWTFQKNVAALQFYSAHGFSAVQETDGSGNEEREPDVLLEWTRTR